MAINDICEITVVRHGETFSNKQNILQGQDNSLLNENGIQQAYAAASRLKTRTFDAVYSSDLKRAMDTADIIAECHPNLKVIGQTSLREWNLGELQGKSYQELYEKYPEIMKAFRKPGNIPRPPGGESIEEFHARVSTFMDETASANIGKKLLFVTHGGAMQRMLFHAMGEVSPCNVIPLSDNASISLFRYRGGQWQLVTWNDTAHLENLQKHELLVF